MGSNVKLGLTTPLYFFYFATAGALGLVSLWCLGLCSPEAASSCSLAATTVMKLFADLLLSYDEPLL